MFKRCLSPIYHQYVAPRVSNLIINRRVMYNTVNEIDDRIEFKDSSAIIERKDFYGVLLILFLTFLFHSESAFDGQCSKIVSKFL